MGLDIRIPIGLLFAIIGSALLAFGAFSNPRIYGRSLDINVNLIWGVVLLVFGLLMLAFGRRAGKSEQARSGDKVKGEHG
jgi:hypothetical protein